MMRASPRFIRAIVINNMNSQKVRVTCQFSSGNSLYYDIPYGQHRIEKNISQGTYQTTDPISAYSI